MAAGRSRWGRKRYSCCKFCIQNSSPIFTSRLLSTNVTPHPSPTIWPFRPYNLNIFWKIMTPTDTSITHPAPFTDPPDPPKTQPVSLTIYWYSFFMWINKSNRITLIITTTWPPRLPRPPDHLDHHEHPNSHGYPNHPDSPTTPTPWPTQPLKPPDSVITSLGIINFLILIINIILFISAIQMSRTGCWERTLVTQQVLPQAQVTVKNTFHQYCQTF